jgi:hypothetical protein
MARLIDNGPSPVIDVHHAVEIYHADAGTRLPDRPLDAFELRDADAAAVDLALTAALAVGAVGALPAGVATETAVVVVGFEIAADAVALAETRRAAVAVVAAETVAVDLAGGTAADTEGTGAGAALDVEVARLAGGVAGFRRFSSCRRGGDQPEDGRGKSA